MAIFNSFLYVYQAGDHVTWPLRCVFQVRRQRLRADATSFNSAAGIWQCFCFFQRFFWGDCIYIYIQYICTHIIYRFYRWFPMKQTYSFNFFHIYGIYGVSESVVHLETGSLLHSSYCSCHFSYHCGHGTQVMAACLRGEEWEHSLSLFQELKCWNPELYVPVTILKRMWKGRTGRQSFATLLILRLCGFAPLCFAE